MQMLQVGGAITRERAEALAKSALRGSFDLPAIDAIFGVGLPGAGRAEMLSLVQDLARSHSDEPTLAAAILQATTAGKAAPYAWSQALPEGVSHAPFELYGTVTDDARDCHSSASQGQTSMRVQLAIEGSAMYVHYSNVRALVDPRTGAFSGKFTNGEGSFSGHVHGQQVHFESQSTFPVREGDKQWWMQTTRRVMSGHIGGPGHTARGEQVDAIVNRASARPEDGKPYGLHFGLPGDAGDGAGDAVHRLGNGQIQGFAEGVVALRDGRTEAVRIAGRFLEVWRSGWTTSGGVGPLGYPLADVRGVEDGSSHTQVQLFEHGYVFKDGRIELRADAEAAFGTRFPKYRTPEELQAERNRVFERAHARSNMTSAMEPLLRELKSRIDARAANPGSFHKTPDSAVIEQWIQQTNRGHAADLIREIANSAISSYQHAATQAAAQRRRGYC